MGFAIDLGKLPPPAQKALSAGAPPPMRMMAARGVLPGLKPGDIVTVVAALTHAEEPDVAATAITTLSKLPAPVLSGALGTELERDVLQVVAETFGDRHELMEQLLRQSNVSGETLALLAERADERLGELIATNEQRMLEFPLVIEKLYMNKRVRMSTADRLLELAVRNGLELDFPAFKEAAAAIHNELILEPTSEPSPDDLLFVATEELAEHTVSQVGEDDTHAEDDEGKEELKPKFVPLYAQLALMTVTQKIRRAMLGTSIERLMLVRDKNRLVAEAAAKSPLLTENDAARIAASKTVSEDVLRIIANSKDHTRNYTVRMNLVTNPRTPFTFSSRIIPLLRDSDLRMIARSKNVPAAIQLAAKRHLTRKTAGGGKH
jgi:hypothetical protein